MGRYCPGLGNVMVVGIGVKLSSVETSRWVQHRVLVPCVRTEWPDALTWDWSWIGIVLC